MRKIITICFALCIAISAWSQDTIRRSYKIEEAGIIPRNVLESYLSRAITMGEFCLPDNQDIFDDDLRMILNIGAKFIGRAAFEWTPLIGNEAHFSMAENFAKQAHEADSTLLLQACIFEAVFKSENNIFASYGVDKIPVPAWVFEEFGLAPETRNFNYADMLFQDGTHEWLWGFGGAPDITQLETQMYFYYRAVRYIDAGYEAIHWGQIMLVGANDAPSYSNWFDLLTRVRNYAKEHARRKILINDAHVINGIKSTDNHLLLDFHSFPQRVSDICGQPYEVEMVIGHGDAIYTKSLGGITPSGWECESLPYLVEFDNSGADEIHTCDNPSWYWPWGWDEATWFAHTTKEYQSKYLRYAVEWLAKNDPVGNLQIPGSIPISADPIPIEGTDRFIWKYRLNNPSPALPYAFGQEDVVKELWDLNKMNVHKAEEKDIYPLASVYTIKFNEDGMLIKYSSGETKEYSFDEFKFCDFTMETDSVLHIIPGEATETLIRSPQPEISATLYPNPFYDNINIQLKENYSYPLEVAIFDINGRKIMHKNFYQDGSFTISTSHLKSGVYICHIQSNDNITIKKLIKQ